MSATSHLPAPAWRTDLTPPVTVREWPTEQALAGMPSARRHLPAVATGRWPSLVDGDRRWRPRLVTLAVLIVFGVLHVLTNDARTSVFDVAAPSVHVTVAPSAALAAVASAADSDEASGCAKSSWTVCNLSTAPQVPLSLPAVGVGVLAVAWMTQLAPLQGHSRGRDRACLLRVTLCVNRT